jgi:hypothetical protein
VSNDLMILPPSALLGTKVRRRGHAGNPGSGPKGETCGTCKAYRTVQGGRSTHPKCHLERANWTGGPGSDIRKRDPSCEFWKGELDAKI